MKYDPLCNFQQSASYPPHHHFPAGSSRVRPPPRGRPLGLPGQALQGNPPGHLNHPKKTKFGAFSLAAPKAGTPGPSQTPHLGINRPSQLETFQPLVGVIHRNFLGRFWMTLLHLGVPAKRLLSFSPIKASTVTHSDTKGSSIGRLAERRVHGCVANQAGLVSTEPNRMFPGAKLPQGFG